MLASINETSLDRFAGGRLRKSGKQDFLRNMNTGDLLDDWVVKLFIYPIHLGCEIASDLADIFGAGWHCDDDFSMTLGAMQRWGGEKAPDQVRAPIFTNNRIRQGNEFGVWYAFAVRILKHDWVDFGNIIGGQPMGGNWHFYGYGSLPESSEKAHIAHMSDIRHNFSWDNPCYTFDDLIRSIFGGADPSNCYTASSSMCQLNKANACLAEAFFALPHQSSFTLDAHWDGNFSQQAAGGPNVVFEWIDWPSGPVAVGQYDASIWSEGGPSRVNHGVAPYQMKTPLHHVAFANYTYPSTNELSNRGSGNSYAQDSYHGPSVTVVGVKAADKVRTIKYRKLKNPFPITAIARAQVYYQKSPNRPYESPSLFNPHWNARLAPLRDANVPWFTRRLLPFMQSGGISLESTH
ncbi:MAG: hypothetical protein IT290_05545 [Deltaproteobacteria bacterium]|nr:hypothetical protein [Deltaproteobacteria bacterium]